MAVKSRVLKAVVGLMALCLAGYIVGPPLYWHLLEGIASVSRSSSASSCPSCICECDSLPLLTIPKDLSNMSFADCAKHDPDVSEDTQKNFAELLSEELKLREAEALEISSAVIWHYSRLKR
ncbi:uncharacterized protein LOC111372297 [Olea europaea subsp. europaea]|uniref:Uncharacterized protein LOC111372297 n=1 Tax=Olea europaea subsp. europaea TaxID=158383 RepID=A0A8S0QTE4_OLEEU|nr:uncharacterized protein LOC111372297 [Olea europaea subsp. europaea]